MHHFYSMKSHLQTFLSCRHPQTDDVIYILYFLEVIFTLLLNLFVHKNDLKQALKDLVRDLVDLIHRDIV